MALSNINGSHLNEASKYIVYLLTANLRSLSVIRDRSMSFRGDGIDYKTLHHNILCNSGFTVTLSVSPLVASWNSE